MLSWRKEQGSEPEQGASAPSGGAGGQDRFPSAAEFGEMLVAAGLINQDQLGEALGKAESEGIFLGRVLVEAGSVNRRQLTSFIVKECRIPHLSLVDYEINVDLLELIPKEACLRHRVLPIDKLGRILTLAMVNPLDAEALAQMRELCPQLKIKPILCDWEDYDLVATRLFAAGAYATGGEVSMSSFGLTEGTPDKSEEELTAASLMESAPVESTPAPRAAVPLAGAGAGADLATLVTALREGLRESNQETLAVLKAALAQQARQSEDGNGGVSLEVMSTTIEASVTQALKDGLRGLAEEIRALRAEPAASGGEGTAAPAMQESFLAAIKELAEAVQRGAGTKAVSADGSPVEGLEGVAHEIRTAAEAAMEAVREALSAQKDSMEALSSDYASKVKRFNTVQPFRGADGDKATADALEAVVMPEDERVRQALDASAPLAGFSFDSFLVSKANEFTVNLARQIAAEPGGAHNPFFVFGPVGIGKTHLVNAVGNAILAARGETRVGYASAGRFAGKAMEALHERASAAFREAYCHWDVLILDDIQFLGGHVEAQEEFFHIFNALQQEGRQIIIAADKAPDRLGQLEQRLISRFAGGMVSPLEPPDYETRVEILKQLAAQGKAKVPQDVLAIVATRVPSDVRRMVGAMRKIIAFTGLVGQDVTSETAYEILSKMGVAEAAPS